MQVTRVRGWYYSIAPSCISLTSFSARRIPPNLLHRTVGDWPKTSDMPFSVLVFSPSESAPSQWLLF